MLYLRSLAIQVGVAADLDPHLLIGAAISGAIFGDMTSPISDTGIVSSMATGNDHIDHIDHIRTQFPYVLVVGLISCLIFAILGRW